MVAKKLSAAEQRWPALKSELRPVTDLVAYQQNPVEHPQDQVDDLADMIQEFGWTMPILVDEAGEIIAGHGRLAAAQKLGIERVPVATASGWSEAQKRAYRIADNSVARRANLLPDMINLELDALDALNFDTSRFGLSEIALPDLDPVDAVPAAPRAPRKNSTIFLTVPNGDAERARTVVAKALDKAKITHNL